MSTRTIGTDIVLKGEKEFNSAMTAVNSNLKTMKSDMALVSAEFDGNAGSVEALTAKQKILSDSVDQHKAKVDALNRMYQRQVELNGENSSGADKYRQQLNQATVALKKEEAALEAVEDALHQANVASSAYTPVTTRLAKAFASARKSIKDNGKTIKETAHEVPVIGEAMDVASASVKGLKVAATGARKAVGALGSAAAGVGKALGQASLLAIKGTAVALGAIATAGVTAAVAVAGFAREQADAAKAAAEAGETLTASQQKWLAFSGQLDALDAAVSAAKGALAGVLLPVLSDLSTEGAKFLGDFAADMEAAGGDAQKQGEVLSKYIVDGANLIKQKLPEYIDVGKQLFAGLGEGLSEAGPELLDYGIDIVFDLLDTIISNAPALGDAGIYLIQKLMETLIERGPDLLTSAVSLVAQLVSGLAQAAPDLIPAAANLVTQLLTALIQAAPELLLAGLELVYGIISGLTTGLGNIASAAGSIIDTAMEAFGARAEEFLTIGDNIVKGIWNGLVGGTSWLYDKVTGWMQNLVAKFKKEGEIKSPSRRFGREIGRPIGQGIVNYFVDELANSQSKINDALNTAFDVPDLDFGGSSGYRGRSVNTASRANVSIYITAKTITEAEINMIMDLVNRKLGEAL